MTLEQGIIDYLRLSRPQFCENNPNIPPIFASAAVSLASRLWLEGSDLIPSTWYIALIGEPRSGKSAFFRKYFRLFSNSSVREIPIGSPEAMLMAIDKIQHGYVYYDEVSHLARLLDSYMGPLISILNKAYYLDSLSQIRVNEKKSVVIDSESYFLHVYFGGTPADWASIERRAPGGFVRRTLVLPVRGTIPFFKKALKNRRVMEYMYRVKSRVAQVLRVLSTFDITVFLPEYPELAKILSSTMLENEKKSMVEEYFYKLLAGRVVARLVVFDPTEDLKRLDASEVLRRMEVNAEKAGVQLKVVSATSTTTQIELVLDEQEPASGDDSQQKALDGFLPPGFSELTFKQLLDTVRPQIAAPDEVIAQNAERIKLYVETTKMPVVSLRTFIRRIVHTGNPQFYRPVLDLLQEGGYIRVVDGVYRGRNVKYVVLDTEAKVCGNCAFYRNPSKCPKLAGVRDIKAAAGKVNPADAACDRFELDEGVSGGGD